MISAAEAGRLSGGLILRGPRFIPTFFSRSQTIEVAIWQILRPTSGGGRF